MGERYKEKVSAKDKLRNISFNQVKTRTNRLGTKFNAL